MGRLKNAEECGNKENVVINPRFSFSLSNSPLLLSVLSNADSF